MSLRQIQTRNFLEFIISSYLSSGKKPSDAETFRALNYYFSEQPAGAPIRLGMDMFRESAVSNVDDVNDFMAAVQVNLSNLFQQVDEHLDQNTMLTTALLAQMKAVKMNRKRLEGQVDDLLLGIYNTDGFFYSISDDFFDSSLTDFSYTDAFLDIESGIVALPANSDQTRLISLTDINEPEVKVFERKDIGTEIFSNRDASSLTEFPFEIETPFNNAVDGLTNTAWYIKVTRVEPSEGIFVRVSLDIYADDGDLNITQVTLIPHGAEPVQCSVQKVVSLTAQTSETKPFSNYIKKSAEKMVFINEDSTTGISKLIFEFSKEKPDYYEDNIDGTRSGIYIIGLKELMITQQAYDPAATFVSKRLSIPNTLAEDQVIDSVSLTVEDNVPANSQIQYYVAADNPNATLLSDFDWKPIRPIANTEGDKRGSVVNLNGSALETRYIRKIFKNPTDIRLIPINPESRDLKLRNPDYSLSSEFPVFRIAAFKESFLTGTLTLEEGINTTRILHTALSDQNIENTFEFWKNKQATPGSYVSTFGETDAGTEFFYGADVGENERSVYIETNIYTDQDSPVVLKTINKSNPNSKLWTVKAFLNGREIANMPVGIDSVTAPLKLNTGKNTVIFAVNIPPSSSASLSPYIGSIHFDPSELGTFKLGELIYVDLYKFKDNGYREIDNSSPNKWFTIFNDEIVTRSRLTNNYRIRYSKPTGNGPEAIRLRADLSRFNQDNRVSPTLDSYRVRFSYVTEEL